MIKIHVGCGKRDFGPEWIHVDGGRFDHLLHHDIRLKRHATNSASVIYCSHMLEYFTYGEAAEILQGWYRVLAPSGILRIAVPDFERICFAYGFGFAVKDIIGPVFGKMEMNGEIIRHESLYDFEKLEDILIGVGFSVVKKYDWRNTEHAHIDDHSRAHLPHDPEAIRIGNFTDQHILISLNVEATK